MECAGLLLGHASGFLLPENPRFTFYYGIEETFVPSGDGISALSITLDPQRISLPLSWCETFRCGEVLVPHREALAKKLKGRDRWSESAAPAKLAQTD